MGLHLIYLTLAFVYVNLGWYKPKQVLIASPFLCLLGAFITAMGVSIPVPEVPLIIIIGGSVAAALRLLIAPKGI